MNPGSVAIIIVNWNTGSLLARCLASLESLPERDLIEKVYVIDNASRDTSLTQAQTIPVSYPVEWIKSAVNIGFARANNLALRKLQTEQSLAHILLLNPDTEVKAGALTSLVDTLARWPKAGIVGPKLLNPDGSLQKSVRRFPTFPVFLTFFLKIKRLVQDRLFWKQYMCSDFNYDQEKSVDQVMGAVFLIRHEAWRQIGNLDERYWIWFEEVDYCWRAAHHAPQRWEVVYTPRAQVIHYGGVSFSQLLGLRRTWPFVQSALVYTGLHGQPWQFMILWLLTPVALVLALPATIWHWQQKRQHATHTV